MCTLVSDFFAYLFCFMFSPTFTALPLSLRYAIDCSVFRGARPSFLSFPSYVSFIDKFSVNCLTSQFQGVPPLYGIWRRPYPLELVLLIMHIFCSCAFHYHYKFFGHAESTYFLFIGEVLLRYVLTACSSLKIVKTLASEPWMFFEFVIRSMENVFMKCKSETY